MLRSVLLAQRPLLLLTRTSPRRRRRWQQRLHNHQQTPAAAAPAAPVGAWAACGLVLWSFPQPPRPTQCSRQSRTHGAALLGMVRTISCSATRGSQAAAAALARASPAAPTPAQAACCHREQPNRLLSHQRFSSPALQAQVVEVSRRLYLALWARHPLLSLVFGTMLFRA